MTHSNGKDRVLQGKIVYYGPALCGKTTNLVFINRTLPGAAGMTSLASEGDRTIFFDYLPVDLGNVRGSATSFTLYTVPGQVRYNQSRRMVLKNVDGIVFVADSRPTMQEANLESLNNLYSNLEDLGICPDELSLVIQYNKRDTAPVMTLAAMREQLNPQGLPEFLACAAQGTGVIETLSRITGMVFKRLSRSFGDDCEQPSTPT